MQESNAARDAWLRFCDAVSHGKVDEFDDIVSQQAHLVIGTGPGEMVETREQMRYGMETEGVTLEPKNTRGWEEGTIGWVVDEPRFGFPDGSGMECRVTAILRKEDETWRIVHAHFSVGVPDEEVAELQARWSAGA